MSKYPVGTIFQATGENLNWLTDHGAMSWDQTDTEVHRKVGVGEKGYLLFHSEENNESLIAFHPSEVAVFLSDLEIEQSCSLVQMGDGKRPDLDVLPKVDEKSGAFQYPLEQILQKQNQMRM